MLAKLEGADYYALQLSTTTSGLYWSNDNSTGNINSIESTQYGHDFFYHDISASVTSLTLPDDALHGGDLLGVGKDVYVVNYDNSNQGFYISSTILGLDTKYYFDSSSNNINAHVLPNGQVLISDTKYIYRISGSSFTKISTRHLVKDNQDFENQYLHFTRSYDITETILLN